MVVLDHLSCLGKGNRAAMRAVVSLRKYLAELLDRLRICDRLEQLVGDLVQLSARW